MNRKKTATQEVQHSTNKCSGKKTSKKQRSKSRKRDIIKGKKKRGECSKAGKG